MAGLLTKPTRRGTQPTMETRIMNVNLQQGFIVYADTLQPLAVFSRHHKVIFLRAGLRAQDVNLPEDLEHFKIIVQFTDSFGIEVWRPDEYVPLHKAIDQYNRMVGMTVASEAKRILDEG